MKFEELKSLDLRKCATVGDIVDGMRYCAFGARMLGEVARTIQAMVAAKKKPVLIYSGLKDSPLGRLLHNLWKHKWCDRIMLPSQYARQRNGEKMPSSSAHSPKEMPRRSIGNRARAIFINPFDMARPGQIKDGYFPDAVFADPRFVMPVLYRSLDEWINGTANLGSLAHRLISPPMAALLRKLPKARKPFTPWCATNNVFAS